MSQARLTEAEHITGTDDETLEQFRRRIDDIDSRIIDLLNERTGVIEQVGRHKRSRGDDLPRYNLRPGREASMIRSLIGRINQPYPPAAIGAMWRMIISGSLRIEDNLTAVVHGSPDLPCYWLAREYFGAFTPIHAQPSSRMVIGEVIDRKATVGVLPMPTGDNGEDWWLSILDRPQDDILSVFAILPFLAPKHPANLPVALAISHVVPEATGDDTSLLGIVFHGSVSRARLSAAFEEQGLAIRWVQDKATQRDISLHLLEVDGFLSHDDARLKAIEERHELNIDRIRVIGAYANPITLDN